MQKYFSHGKLLISGEYVVLDGATAFALPTRFGQSLEIEVSPEPGIKWKSLDEEGKPWFEHTFQKMNFSREISVDNIDFRPKYKEVGKRLFELLQAAISLNPHAFSSSEGYEITTKVDFPPNWGLGTSSTLLSNIAKWLKIDAYKLLEMTFGGSGYDVAVALESAPITYELHGDERSVLLTSFDPSFKEEIFFVYLNRKQDSRHSIQDYRSKDKRLLQQTIEKISNLTHRIITCTDLEEFKLLLEIHENLVSQLTGFKKIKSQLFSDFQGVVKSLGGWGGDFILATGKEADKDYFRRKGYNTIIPYKDLILS